MDEALAKRVSDTVTATLRRELASIVAAMKQELLIKLGPR
jgi:hypothetical protein